MGSAAGGRPPMKRSCPAFSEEPLPEYGIERAQMMMSNNRVFRSLGVTQLASILSSRSNAKGTAREELDPLYGPAGDEDSEHGVVNKISETRNVVRPIGETRGSKRVLAGPTQQDPTARVISKRAQDQLMNGEDDAVPAAPVAPAQVDEEEEMDNEEEPLTEYERERAHTIMRNNQLFRSLGITPMDSILNSSTNAKSKCAAREDSDPLYEPASDDEDIEHGAINKVSKTRSVGRPLGGTRGSKRVPAGPTQRELGEGVITRKRARGQTSEGSINRTSTNEEDDAVVTAPAQVDEHEEMDIHEGEPNAMINQRSRGRSMGKGLERMSRGLNSKLPVVIVEGKRRPEAPMQAAKLASEGGIVLRQHMPIHPHWKDYKKDKSVFKDFVGKVSVKFSMDPNQKAVQIACSDLLRGGQRQMRHMLKKTYFDDVPANQVRTTSPLKGMTDDQWKALVEMWSSPKHKEKCLKAKVCRGKVKYPHKTGSRCYIAQTYVLKQKEKYKDAPPTAIDLFKDLHCSSKTGLSEATKDAVEQMQAILSEPTEEGKDPKTATEAVAVVLPKSKFLQNVGLEAPAPKKSAASAVHARVQELEEEIQEERQDSAALRCQIEYQQNQLEALTSKIEETEAANRKQQEALETLKKQNEETNSLLRRLLCPNKE
ncbi:unnamed protein product [Urochloa humidicola]